MIRKETRHTEFEQMLRRSHRILYRICLAFTAAGFRDIAIHQKNGKRWLAVTAKRPRTW